jgi:FKBP12-rapamycin complex-associated protein
MQVMAILRENRDSLVATLEAFVHDPLISWRLLNTKKYVTTACAIDTVTLAHFRSP